MPTNSRDAAALWDMVQAIQEIQEDVAGLSYEDFWKIALCAELWKETLKSWANPPGGYRHLFRKNRPFRWSE
jgi:hypothetical protein